MKERRIEGEKMRSSPKVSLGTQLLPTFKHLHLKLNIYVYTYIHKNIIKPKKP